MSQISKLRKLLDEQNVESVEMIVSDMAGIARGKIQPAADLGSKDSKLPLGVFAQTINGDYVIPRENVEDRDMYLRPDVATLRPVPWAGEPTASVIMDCYDTDGQAVDVSSRNVLKRVVDEYEAEGWTPVVAPEVEFYLTKRPESGDEEDDFVDPVEPPLNDLADPYGIDGIYDLGKFFDQLSDYCRIQNIPVGAVSQELGPAQFEVNFHHGSAVQLADDVFHFKRTIRRLAIAHGMRVTFLAKPKDDDPGSSMHLHQSVYDKSNENVFSDSSGKASKLFDAYLGGLQKYMPNALLLFAPYANSYRRFLNYDSSPVNLEWGIDNRTVGLRVPESDANARRVENRLAGSDVNPYLAIAGTLACGYLGMKQKLSARPVVEGSAYDLPFALHRHFYEALDAFRESDDLREVLGDDFVTMYSNVKELEYREYQRHIGEWDREELKFSV
ncbi:MAG: glutamine synthetase [Gammaproteobacteria bacterium]|nr:glutamine synthetase [Gammaproteobacteria bacterium]